MDEIKPPLGGEKENEVASRHVYAFTTSLGEMFQESELTDVTVVCGNRKFPTHKAILCASSPFFRALFRSGLQESKNGHVNVKGIDSESFEVVLKIMYFQPFPEMKETSKLKNILAASHMLQLWYLYDYCSIKLMGKLNHSYFIDIWSTAELYEQKQILQEIPSELAKQFHKVKDSGDFILLKLEQLKALMSYLNKTAKCTDDIVKSVLRWINHDSSRIQYLNELLSLAEVKRISAFYLSFILTNEPVIKNSLDVLTTLMDVAASRMAEMCLGPPSSKPQSIDMSQERHSPSSDSEGGSKEPVCSPLNSNKAILILVGGKDGQKVDTPNTRTQVIKQCAEMEYGHQHEATVDLQYQCYDIQCRKWSVALNIPNALLLENNAKILHGKLLYLLLNQFDELGKLSINKTRVYKYQLFSKVPPTHCGTLCTERTSAGAAILDGQMYIVGGKDKHGKKLSSVEKYDIQQNKCVAAQNMPYPASSRHIVVAMGYFYVVELQTSYTILQFDPKITQWSVFQIQLNPQLSQLYAPKRNRASKISVAACHGNIYILHRRQIDKFSHSGQFLKSYLMYMSCVKLWGIDNAEEADAAFLYLLDASKQLYRFHTTTLVIDHLPGSTSIKQILYGGLTLCP